VVPSREALEQRFADAEQRFLGRDVDRPSGWGLYQVEARSVELWLSAPHRLHDRFCYVREGGGWALTRLYP
jgi:pyridoxamine 5'-phosphate oxidase